MPLRYREEIPVLRMKKLKKLKITSPESDLSCHSIWKVPCCGRPSLLLPSLTIPWRPNQLALVGGIDGIKKTLCWDLEKWHSGVSATAHAFFSYGNHSSLHNTFKIILKKNS